MLTRNRPDDGVHSLLRPKARSLWAYASLSLVACSVVLGADQAAPDAPPAPTESHGYTCHFTADSEARKDSDVPSDPLQRAICLDAAWTLARDLEEQGNYAKAFTMLNIMASEGITRAQRELGSLYEQGKGVPVDFAGAAKWYRAAADQGDAQAQWELGWMHEQGKGVPVDFAEAAKWYRLAADQGNAMAQLLLGVAYQLGRGVPKDGEQSVAWLRKAADQDLPLAQYRLGSMYWDGDGVPKDSANAIRWWTMAADHGSGEAQFALGLQYLHGKGVPRDYPTALRFFRQSAQQGNARGQISLGARYLEGQGVSRDRVQAYKWFTIAIANLHDPSDEDLALAKRNREVAARRMSAAEVATATQLAEKCLAEKYQGCD